MRVTCRACRQDKQRIKSDKKHGIKNPKFVYTDDFGNIWSKRMCPSCFKAYKVAHSRKTGKHKDRSESVRPDHKLGYDNEILAMEYLKSMGITTTLGTGKAPT
jgi:hypothetical protein